MKQDVPKGAIKKSPYNTTNYGDHQYWDNRYLESMGKRFDWLENYEALYVLCEEELKGNKQATILNVGCGNAQIQDRLFESGYAYITNNDISPVVIQQMKAIKQSKGYHSMTYQVMDVCRMTYPDESFDMVLDKSTIDALLCSDNPVMATARMLLHIYRVLKEDGVYFMVSYGMPENRLQHLQRKHIKFSIKIIQLSSENEEGLIIHYVYICRKQPMAMFSEAELNQYFKMLKILEDQEYK